MEKWWFDFAWIDFMNQAYYFVFCQEPNNIYEIF